MYLSVLSTAAAVVSLPLLAAASPVATPKGISIPISKRVTKSSPVADIAALRAQLARLEGWVPSSINPNLYSPSQWLNNNSYL